MKFLRSAYGQFWIVLAISMILVVLLPASSPLQLFPGATITLLCIAPLLHLMGSRIEITPIVRGYDVWVGLYLDQKTRGQIYLFLIPCLGFQIDLPLKSDV